MVSAAEDPLRRVHAIPLVPSLHNHLWGSTGSNSLAARLFCYQPGRGSFALRSQEHYSEISLGTHPSTPTRLALASAGGRTLLDHVRTEVIEVEPSQVEQYAHLHRQGLPFVLRLVSVASPQAVHVHPDDGGSARLHAARPDAYADAIGKAELAVAVSPVDALFGFRAPEEIVKELARVPEFADAVGREATDRFVKEVRTGRGGPDSLRMVFDAFVEAEEGKRAECLYAAVRRLEQMQEGAVSEDDTLLLRLHRAFPADAMCFAVYFLNVVRMEPGAAVFVPPKVPHAYLSGDLIEVSTCSTNVARAGLTEETVDVKEFCRNLTYDVSLVKVCSDVFVFFIVGLF